MQTSTRVIDGITFHNFDQGGIPGHDWVFKTHSYRYGMPPSPVIGTNVLCHAPTRTQVFIEGFPEHGRGPAIDPAEAPRRLAGEYHFGGNFNSHFAHFLLDTVSTAWPNVVYESDLPILYFMNPGALGTAYVRDLLRRAGLYDRVHIESQPVVVDRLHLAMPCHRAGTPGDAYLLESDFIGRIRRGIPPVKTTAQPVYLSRRQAHTARCYDGEWLLERLLSREGVRVVHPNDLNIRRHIELVNRHDTIISPCGAACYPLFFATSPSHLVVVDSRITPSFRFLKHKSGIDMSVIRCCTQYSDPGGHFRSKRVFDLAATLQHLKELGLIARDTVSADDWRAFESTASHAEFTRTRSAFGTLLDES